MKAIRTCNKQSPTAVSFREFYKLLLGLILLMGVCYYAIKRCGMAVIGLACEQALLGVEGGRGKEERACNDVSGVFISASEKSTQNADWWILNLVLTSLLFPCVVLTIQKRWKAEFLFVKVARISRNNLGFLWN